MAARVFDTYMPGSVEPFISFINSLSEGRILCLAILVSFCCCKAILLQNCTSWLANFLMVWNHKEHEKLQQSYRRIEVTHAYMYIV